MSIMPMKKAKYVKSLILKEKPSDIIHAVTVVPMWAPIMTEIACIKVSRPALTKLTVIRVVAVLDCTAAVTNMPVHMPVKRLVVMVPSTWRNCGPAIFCRASLIDFIPNISNASEPSNLKITIIIYKEGVFILFFRIIPSILITLSILVT